MALSTSTGSSMVMNPGPPSPSPNGALTPALAYSAWETTERFLTLMCLVVGHGSVFSVKLEQNETVHALKERIQDKIQRSVHCDAYQLALYIAKNENGNWLTDDDAHVLDLSRELFSDAAFERYVKEEMEMKPSRRVRHPFFAFPDEDSRPDGTIQVLVVEPNVLTRRDQVRADSRCKRARWEQINRAVQERAKREKMDPDMADLNATKPQGTGEVVLAWRDIESVYASCTKHYNLQPSYIPDDILDAMYACMYPFAGMHGMTWPGNEARHRCVITPLFAYVCHMFSGQAHILVDEQIRGERVHTMGEFAFVLRRGGLRVGIVQAPGNDMEQGLARALLGCEALADTAQFGVVFGIVTNYANWIFVRSEMDCVYQCVATIQFDARGLPSRESLRAIAGMIHAMLTD